MTIGEIRLMVFLSLGNREERIMSLVRSVKSNWEIISVLTTATIPCPVELYNWDEAEAKGVIVQTNNNVINRVIIVGEFCEL